MDTLIITGLEIVNAITILVMLALGLAVIFGMMRIVNLAQGEFLTLGAYTVVVATQYGGLPLWAAMVLAPVVVALIGVALERSIIQRFYGRPLDVMLATWGVSLLLIGILSAIFGPNTRGFNVSLGSFQIGPYQYPVYRLVMTAVAAAMMTGIYVLFHFTGFGRRARATMTNPEMASAIGINTGRMYMLTFGLGAALAGATGAMLSLIVGVVPTMGTYYIARAFITVVVGGPLILLGTLTSGSVLGFFEAIVSRYTLFSIETEGLCSPAPCELSVGGSAFFGQVALLLVSMVLLRLLPQGISGVRKGDR